MRRSSIPALTTCDISHPRLLVLPMIRATNWDRQGMLGRGLSTHPLYKAWMPRATGRIPPAVQMLPKRSVPIERPIDDLLECHDTLESPSCYEERCCIILERPESRTGLRVSLRRSLRPRSPQLGTLSGTLKHRA